MTPTEKLLSNLANILPRRDWELHLEAITKMVEAVYEDGRHDLSFGDVLTTNEPTEAKS